MELWLVFAAIAVFIGGAAVYLFFMIFFPEWVGITGETALKAEQSHRGDSSTLASSPETSPTETIGDPLKGVSVPAERKADPKN